MIIQEMRKMSQEKYNPRTALILMKPEHAEIGRTMGIYLAVQGVQAHMETDELSSTVLLGIGNYDMVVIGPGYDHITKAVTTDPMKRPVLTVAATNNGVTPDVKVENQMELFDYAVQGRITEAYRTNARVQDWRQEMDSPNMDLAELEITLMKSTSKGQENVDPLAQTVDARVMYH